MKRTIILAVLMTALFSSCLDTGCRYVRGNGHITREMRDIGDFNGDGRGDLLRYRIFQEGVSGGDVLLSAAAGIFPGTTASPAREDRGNGRWLDDLPSVVEDMSGTQEKALVDAIKNRIAGGEKISFLEIKKEYEKLSGRKCRRVKILRLLKKYKLNQ